MGFLRVPTASHHGGPTPGIRQQHPDRLRNTTGRKVQFPQNGNPIETLRKPHGEVSRMVYAMRKLHNSFRKFPHSFHFGNFTSYFHMVSATRKRI